MGKATKTKTVPQSFHGVEGKAPAGTIKASAAAVAALAEKRERRRLIEAQQREERAQAQREVEDHLAQVERKAAEQGEEAVRSGKGPLQVLARDGLMWAFRKGTLDRAHYDAGLRFRDDYECAQGEGLRSCLAGNAGRKPFDPHASGPTVAMIAAAGEVKEALKALGTPMLHRYVVLVAGEGAMLTDPRIGGPKGAGDHVLPCRIAFDLLARHYGMIR